MHEYDIALKQLLQASSGSLIAGWAGVPAIARWLNVEFGQVQSRRADLLGETENGRLVHIELQSRNDPDMALRMAEYALSIYRQLRRPVRQIVFYVGQAPLNMPALLDLSEPGDSGAVFSYELVDARNLESAPLLASDQVQENVLAILTRLADPLRAIRLILERIATADESTRRTLLAQFLILSGLRSLAQQVEEEAHRMPILDDILDHEVIGPAIRKGLAEGRSKGRAEGRSEGRAEGRSEGRQEIVLRLLERRFGSLSPSTRDRLFTLSADELDDLAVRILDALSLESLFPPKP